MRIYCYVVLFLNLVLLSVLTIIYDHFPLVEVVARILHEARGPVAQRDMRFVLTTCDYHHTEEARMTIKSARMFADLNDQITFYIIAPESQHGNITSWRMPGVTVHVMEPAWPSLPHELQAMTKVGPPCVMIRLFLTEMLPQEDLIIYLDTDTLFLAPPGELWDMFQHFSDQQSMAFALINGIRGTSYLTPHPSQRYYPPHGLNAGVALLHLARMREAQFSKGIQKIYRDHGTDIKMADQGLINYYLHYRPQANYLLPCNWNFRNMMCSLQEKFCSEAIRDGIKLLHGHLNTFHKDVKLLNEFRTPPFLFVYLAFEDFDLSVGGLSEYKRLVETINNSVSTGRYGELTYPGADSHGCAHAQLYTTQIEAWIRGHSNHDQETKRWTDTMSGGDRMTTL